MSVFPGAESFFMGQLILVITISRLRHQLNLSTRNQLQNTWAARANSELTGPGGRNNAKDI